MTEHHNSRSLRELLREAKAAVELPSDVRRRALEAMLSARASRDGISRRWRLAALAVAVLAMVSLLWHLMPLTSTQRSELVVVMPSPRTASQQAMIGKNSAAQPKATMISPTSSPDEAPVSSHPPGAGRTAAAVPMRPTEPLLTVIAVRQPTTVQGGGILALGDRLPAGSVVQTAKQGRVTLITRHGSEFTLAADSRLAIARDGKSVDFEKGRLYCRNREHEFAAITTPAGKIKLLGTIVDAVVKNLDTVVVTVVQGMVRLENAHGEAVVDAGQEALLVAHLPPMEAKPVNTLAETAWYDGRGTMASNFGQLAYTVERADLLAEVWVMNADGTGKHRIKSYIGRVFQPGQWLPGEQILLVQSFSPSFDWPDFRARRAHATRGEWMTEPWTQTWLTNVASGQDMACGLSAKDRLSCYTAVSPDSKKIAFSGWDKEAGPFGSASWVYDLPTGAIRKVLSRATFTQPSWSPDGSAVVASVAKEDVNNLADQWLVMIDAHTGQAAELGVQGTDASFSPDGDRLVYCGGFDLHHQGKWHDHHGVPGIGSLFILDLAPGARPRRLTPAGEGSFDPRWSPDGTRVLYETMQDEPTGPDGSVTHMLGGRPTFTLFVVSIDDSEAKQIYQGAVTQASWAPSGDAVYVATEDGVVLVSAGGSGVLSHLGGSACDSILSPEEQAQTQAALAAIQEAVFQYAVGALRAYQGRPAESRSAYQAAGRLFAQLPWQYPLVHLSTEDVLRYADLALQLASRSDAVVLAEACKAHLSNLTDLVSWYEAEHQEFVTDVAAALEWLTTEKLVVAGARLGHWIPLDQLGTIGLVSQCPLGDAYVYSPPAAGDQPKAGDVLAMCPRHPQHRVVWRQLGNALYLDVE